MFLVPTSLAPLSPRRAAQPSSPPAERLCASPALALLAPSSHSLPPVDPPASSVSRFVAPTWFPFSPAPPPPPPTPPLGTPTVSPSLIWRGVISRPSTAAPSVPSLVSDPALPPKSGPCLRFLADSPLAGAHMPEVPRTPGDVRRSESLHATHSLLSAVHASILAPDGEDGRIFESHGTPKLGRPRDRQTASLRQVQRQHRHAGRSLVALPDTMA